MSPNTAHGNFRLWHGALALSALLLCTFTQAAAQVGAGYWHTNGASIVDANGSVVRIAGINWYGGETTDENFHGLYDQDYKYVLNTIQYWGYNTIRIPLSNQEVESPIVPSNISFTNSSGPINTDLQGLNSLQILDKVIAYAGSIGLRVILDNHRSEAGNSAEQSGLWYTSAYPESAWINDWKTLTNRYLNNTTVIGMDLRNEPHAATGGGSCWTGDTTVSCSTTNTTNNWPQAATRAGNAILALNPKLLIFVEGTDCYSGDCDWWGGNLEGAGNNPVVLSVANQLVYSAHDYGPNLFQQTWFNSSTTYSSLASVWTKFWGYLSINGTAPVWVGEFGTTNNNSDISSTAAGSQGQWFSSLVQFLQNTSPAMEWTYWALNGEDSYSLLDNNYDQSPLPALSKQQLLAGIQFPLGSSTTNPPTNLKATAASTSSINLSWTASTSSSVSYSLFRSTNSTFQPGSSNQIASGLTGTSYSDTGLTSSTTYYYYAKATNSTTGTSSPSNQAHAITQGLPAAAASLAATAISSSQINLSWTGSSTIGVTYVVYRSTTSGFTPSSSNQVASGVTATSYSDIGLTASTTYYYLVEANDANGNSAASNQASATTQAFSIYINTGGSAVSGTSWTADTDFTGSSGTNSTTGVVSTTGVTNPAPQAVYQTERWGAMTYTIPGMVSGNTYSVDLHFDEFYWSTTGQREFNVSINNTQVMTNFDIVAAAGGTFKAIVKTFTATANSSGQIVINFTAGAVDQPKIDGIDVTSSSCTASMPAAPTSLTAAAASSSQINLNWTASSTSGVTYSVFRSTTSGFTPSLSNQVTSGVSGTTFSDTGLSASTAYYYLVKAVNCAGSSSASNQASATTQPAPAPAAPTNLTATAASSSQINLSWTAPTTSGVTYSVFRSTSSGFTPSSSNQITSGVSGTTYSNTGLSASTTYYYLVEAVNSSGSSPASNQASATTQAAASTNFAIALQSVSPNPSHVGSATNVTVDFKNNASNSVTVTLITEITNSSGTVVANQSFTGTITPGQTQNVQATWSPTATGSYNIIGVVQQNGTATQSANVGTLTVN
jgi:endoglucanase